MKVSKSAERELIASEERERKEHKGEREKEGFLTSLYD